MNDEKLFNQFLPDFEAMSQRPNLRLELTPVQAWELAGQIQLACRHPQNIGSSRQTAELIARTLLESLATTPALKTVAERGWLPEFDEDWSSRAEPELADLLAQLHTCGYTCVAGPLEKNVAWIELERLAGVREAELTAITTNAEEFEELTLRIIAAASATSPIDIRHLGHLVDSVAPYLARQLASEALLFAANMLGSLEPGAVMYILGLMTGKIDEAEE